ncbi:PKD domain-containing protein [Fluviicola sp.]|uniref:PKD domain-containing protein n=1 Tax=Fluviicola sp. TaxID=1917219 RepID=UPI0031D63BD8
MRKILLSLSLFTLTLQASAQTQMGNGGFETWETSTNENAEPVNWNSFKSGTGGVAFLFGGSTMGKITDHRPGSTGIYSVRIWAKEPISGTIAQGNMTCGIINMGSSTPSSTSNYNYTDNSSTAKSEAFTDTPDSVVVWLRYKPTNTAQNDSARVSFVIHKNVNNFKDPNDVNGTNVVAKAIKNIPYTGGGWKRISIPFDYVTTPNLGAYVIGTFATHKTPGGGSDKDSLIIDDVEMIYVPKASFTNTAATICTGGNVTFTSTSTNYPTSYSWNFGDGTPNGTTANPVHQYNVAGTYTATLTVTNQWGSTTSTPVTVTVNDYDDATFSYSSATYCSDAGNQTPTVVDAGTFSSTSGLVINSTTGVIDLAASTPGTYTVTNTTSGACPDTKTTSITINAASDASFSYPSNTICLSDANPIPTTAMAGTFSSTSGLVFVSTTTGEIDVTTSTAGTYTVTYNVGGICPSMSQTNVTLTLTPDAAFSYSQAAYCTNATDPSPVFGTGANGGVFSSTTGLVINSNSGIVDLSASTAGTYTVTNTIAAVGSCPSDVETATIIVNAAPNVTLANFSDVCVYNPAFALTGGAPAGGNYSGTGVSGGNFNPATAGIGTETITYSFTDANGCSNTATNTIMVDECLGLNETELEAITVYPNPTEGKLILSNITGNTTYTVVSVSGQVVSNGVVSSAANSIDISAFENGVYVLQLSQEQGVQSIRIIKK